MTASFLASIKNTESILLTISFSDSFVFIYFYKVSRSKKKRCRFCRLACYVRRNRQCFLISYADRSFLKLFRAGSCILVSYSCRDLFKSVDFLTRKWMKYSLDVYLVNSILILFLSQYVTNTGIVLKGI